jgi:uncharacterized protein (TIGR04255 family)
MKLPKKLTPSPVYEVSIDLRFQPNIDSAAVFGLIYKDIRDEFKNEVIKLPSSQLTEEMIKKNEALKYQPYYRIVEGDFVVQIGPRVISLSNTKTYKGWEVFSSKATILIEKTLRLNIIKEIDRLGLRYINFFEGMNILDNLKINLTIADNSLNKNNTYLRTQYKKDNHTTILQITNDATIKEEPKYLKGSILDIDTFISKDKLVENCDIHKFLEEIHMEEKTAFFGALKEEFLKSLSPE